MAAPRPAGAHGRRPWDRLLPPALRGPSRRAAWRRSRARRVAAALLVAAAAVMGLSALRPAEAPAGVPVLVAAHDLPSGTRLTTADVRVAAWPASTAPPATARSVDAVVGRTVNAPVAAGEPLPPGRLRPSGVLADLPSDRVAVHVPLRDPAIQRYLRSGDHVDALSAAGGGTVAAGLLVLARAPTGVLVAATSEQASRLAATIAEDGPGAGVILSVRPRD